MSFAQAIKTSQSSMVYLVTAPDGNSKQPAWWYVQVENKQKLPLFLERVKKSGITFTDYGTILFSGWGSEPPTDIRQKIKDQFG